MARKLLRCLLSAADQLRIDGSTVRLETGPPDYPDAVRIRFKLDPAGGAPKLTPLFAGGLRFIADAGKAPPDASAPFLWTSQEIAAWPTRGTLLVRMPPALSASVRALVPGPRLVPTKAWYWPVRLPDAFLLETMRQRKALAHVGVREGAATFALAHARWAEHAVAGFLAGTYEPELRQDAADERKDDVVRSQTPTLDMAADGTVELWMALAFSPTSTDDVADPLLTPPVALSEFDRRHPRNGALPALQTLKDLGPHLIDAGPADRLAAALLAEWPRAPRHLPIQFSLLGSQRHALNCGNLVRQTVRLEDEAGKPYQERPVPVHGQVWLTQPAPVDPTQPPTAPGAVLSFPAAPLRLTDSEPSLAAPTAGKWGVDLAAPGLPPRITLSPPAPAADPASRHAYSRSLARMVFAMTRAPATQKLVKDTLAQFEADIRPPGWPPATIWTPSPPEGSPSDVFVGARTPWTYVLEGRLAAFFDGLQNIVAIGAGPKPPIRPAEAVVVWVMEGLLALVENAFFAPGWRDFGVAPPSGLSAFAAADINGASAAQIKTVLRVIDLWNHWGLDDFNHHSGAADNQPVLAGALAAAVANHNAQLSAALANIAAAGFAAPTSAEVNAAFEVRPVTVGGVVDGWQFRPSPTYVASRIALQYSEYLRRQVLLASQLTEEVWKYPAYGYMAYNGGLSPHGAPTVVDPGKPVFVTWADAVAQRAGNPACADKDMEDALRCWQITPAEVQRMAAHGAEGRFRRRFVARINAIHFSALLRSYASVFPRAL